MQMLTRHGPISSWTLPNTDRGASCKERKDLIDMTHTQIYIYICATQISCVMQFGLTCGKHIKHFLCLIADLKSKALPNNDMPARTKLLVENFLEKKLFGAFKYFNSLYLDVFCTKFIVGGVIFAGIVANFHHLEILLCLGVS